MSNFFAIAEERHGWDDDSHMVLGKFPTFDEAVACMKANGFTPLDEDMYDWENPSFSPYISGLYPTAYDGVIEEW